MALRREIIEAMLRVKDQGRFKSGMKSAARSVRDFGHEGTKAAAEHELLVKVLEELQKEVAETRVFMKGLAKETDEAGDQARQTARSYGVLALMQRRLRGGGGARGGGLLGLLGLSGRWKDTLSLTSAEVKSTALTIGSYLIPALISLTSSLAGAVMGVGVVGGAGLAALVVGLSGAGLTAITVSGQIKKVKQAQDAYNLAVAQYGAGSKQAAAASARLYGVIKENGGRPVWEAVKALRTLKDTWTATTGPARQDLFGIMRAGIGGAQRLLPTFARQTNLNTMVMRQGLTTAFRSLSGNEMKTNITALSHAFRQMFGPLTRGGVNLLIAMFRVFRIAAPYAVEFAHAFERWTMRLRSGSKDTARLEGFIADTVGHFKAWWGLLKAVGRLLGTVFTGSAQQGQDLVVSLTNIVDRFNKWLNVIVGPNGETRISHFFTAFNNSLYLLFSDPQEFANRVARFFAVAAANGGMFFLRTWWSLDWPHKLFIAAVMFRGAIFTLIGRLAAAAFISSFAPRMAAALGAEGAAAGVMAGSGAALGAIFGRAFLAAAITFGVVALWKYLDKHPLNPGGIFGGVGDTKKGDTGRRPLHTVPGEIHHLRLRPPTGKTKPIVGMPNPWRRKLKGPGLGKKGSGGMIYPGQAAWVGDQGPEIAIASPSGGTVISPVGKGSANLKSMQPPSIDLSNMAPLPPVHVHVDIDKREIARAYINHQEDRKSKRGGRA